MSDKIEPDSREYCKTGFEYYYAGELEWAKEEFNRAIELDRECSEAYYGRGICHLDSAYSSSYKATCDFTRSIEIDPSQDKAHSKRKEALNICNLEEKADSDKWKELKEAQDDD